MRKQTFVSAILVSLMATSMVLAQDKMGKMDGKMGMQHKMDGKMGMQSKMSMDKMGMMSMMMKGLTADEKATAMGHMKKMSESEHKVMMKRASMCMKDKHAGMNMKGKMDDKMMMDHMMSGLSKSEQSTMSGMMSKMTAKEKAVSKKMMMNCCTYGMKHGK